MNVGRVEQVVATELVRLAAITQATRV
jgi:hypothetical protein